MVRVVLQVTRIKYLHIQIVKVNQNPTVQVTRKITHEFRNNTEDVQMTKMMARIMITYFSIFSKEKKKGVAKYSLYFK